MMRIVACCILLVFLGALVVAIPSPADRLEMKDGRVIAGKYLGGTRSQIRFLVDGNVELHPAEEILAVTFGSETNPLADAPTNPPRVRPDQWKIMSWGGDTSQWRRSLSVSALRIGCNNPPEECVEVGNNEASKANAASYSIGLELSAAYVPIPRVKEWAREFSRLSLENPKLVEFSLDDFGLKLLQPAYNELEMTPRQVEALVDDIIRAAKSANPNLKFGITMYENELRTREDSFLDDAHLSPRLRKKFDLVHLFINYRMNGPQFAEDVQRAKELFPNARIIAGSYPYDRIDFMPCSWDDHKENWWSKKPQARCTLEQEKAYFQQSLEVQVRLLRQGQIEAIEFFPGSLGNEDQIPWHYYDSAPWGMGCLRSKQTCVANTRALNQIASATLSFYKEASRIAVRPAASTVAPRGRQQFTAIAVDQSGKAISPQPAFDWSVSRCGTISSAGLFVAGSNPTGEGSCTVTASAYGMSGTTNVTVAAPSPPES